MLYYTGAIKPEDMQVNPSLSLGGFKSSSQIPNGTIHNLFPKITQSTVIKDKKIIRMIVLQNITSAIMSNVKIYIEGGEYSIFTAAAIAPGYDPVCERYFFEKVSNEEGIPYQGTLESHGEDNPIIIDSLAVNQLVGIWIRKSLDQTKFTDLDKGKNGIDCDETIKLLQEQEELTLPIEDQMKFHVEWD